MKSVKFAIVVASVLMAGGIVAQAQIAGSGHDFTNATWNVGMDNEGEMCAPCHTPHKAKSALVPLWNHETSNPGTWVLYDSPTMAASTTDPTGASLACLSCHDGSIALNAYGGNTANATMIPATHIVGASGDLSKDHPVSFTYQDAVDGDTFINGTNTVVSVGNGISSIGDMLKSGSMECSTCHDVHAQKGDASSANKLLVVDNAGSALCLTCHNK